MDEQYLISSIELAFARRRLIQERAMERMSPMSPLTRKRNVVSADGITIDEKDYHVLKRVCRNESLSDMVAGKKSRVTCLKISNKDEGFRVVEFSTSKHPITIRDREWGYHESRIDLKEFAKFDALEYLMLDIYLIQGWYGGERVMALPNSIWNMKNLKRLRIYCNVTLNLQNGIDRLTSLEELHIGYTTRQKLSLPDGIGRLRNLNILRIRDTKILSVPSFIGQLTNLKCLDLYGNRYLESIPDFISRLTGLEKLDLGNTGIRSLPSVIGNLVNLKSLRIPFPLGSDDLPVEMDKLEKLEYLNLMAPKRHTNRSINADILSRISTILEHTENIRSLHIPTSVIFNSEETYKVLLEIAQRRAYLGCFGRRIINRHQDRPKYNALLDCLLRNTVNRYFSRSQNFPLSLWPLILSKTEFPLCTKYCSNCNNCWNSYHSGKKLPPSNIIFHLLVNHGVNHIFHPKKSEETTQRSINCDMDL